MHNIIVFIEQSEHTFHPVQKITDLFLNRFTIDEEAAFDALEVHYLEKCSKEMSNRSARQFADQRQAKARIKIL